MSPADLSKLTSELIGFSFKWVYDIKIRFIEPRCFTVWSVWRIRGRDLWVLSGLRGG